MLTAEGCAARRKRLWDALPTPCDLLIVGDPQHLIYFGNYAQSPFVFRSSDAGALLVLTPEKATLVSDNMAKAFWTHATVDEVVAPVWYAGKTSAPRRQSLLVQSTLDEIAELPARRIGVETSSVPAGVVEALEVSRPGLEVVDLDPIIRPLRRSKDADELALIRQSIRAGEAGHAAALAGVEPGMTELDAYLMIQTVAQREAGQQAIVYGDFVSGPRCEREHGGPPSLRKIERGDLFLVDYSVVIWGYRGDFTNTFAVGADPTPGQVKLYEACIGALAAGEGQLKPGNPARAVDEAVHAHFRALGLDHAFITHSGHGLGLSHPEPPYFVSESTDTIVAGDVVALEPGLYMPGVGGMRFENNYLITPSGFEKLTHHAITLNQRS